MTVSDNPQTAGTEPAPVTDERSAIAAISGLLESEDGSTAAPEKAKPAQESRKTEEPEPEAEDGEELDGDEPPAEQKPRDDAEEPEPDSIEELAKVMEMGADELSKRLTVPVKIDGKQTRVTLQEALAAYSRDGDYRNKTSQLAEQRKAVEAEKAQLGEQAAAKLQELDQAIKMAEGFIAQGPDEAEMERLLNEDPTEYVRQQHRMAQATNKLSAMKAKHREAMEESRQNQAKEMAKIRSEQQEKLLKAVPDLKDQEKLAKFERNVASYLRDSGYSGEEISGFFNGPWDHRQLLLVRDAMRFRAADKAKGTLAKKLENKPKMIKPGTSDPPKKGAEKLAAQKENLRKLGKGRNRVAQDQAATSLVRNILDMGG